MSSVTLISTPLVPFLRGIYCYHWVWLLPFLSMIVTILEYDCYHSWVHFQIVFSAYASICVYIEHFFKSTEYGILDTLFCTLFFSHWTIYYILENHTYQYIHIHLILLHSSIECDVIIIYLMNLLKNI